MHDRRNVRIGLWVGAVGFALAAIGQVWAEDLDYRLTGGEIFGSTGIFTEPAIFSELDGSEEVVQVSDKAAGKSCCPAGETCRSCCGSAFNLCSDSGGRWANAEYLLWWSEGMGVPALVTTSPDGTAQSAAGVLPGATVLFGGERIGPGVRSGGRVSLGQWLDPHRQTGLGARFFGVGDGSHLFSAQSTGSPILARPFFNEVSDAEDAALVAFPSVLDGRIDVRTDSEIFGADVALRHLICSGCNYTIDMILGYQFSRINEELTITEALVVTDPGGFNPLGTTIDTNDIFDTQNEFHGFLLGMSTEMIHGCWRVEVLTQVALGNMHQTATIDGSQVVTEPGDSPLTTSGGLLALPTNMGIYEEDEFTVVPELGVTLSYEVCCNLEMSMGYSFIYWSQAARAGGQIDRGINTTQIGGGAHSGENRPVLNEVVTSDYWLQGLNFGLKWCF